MKRLLIFSLVFISLSSFHKSEDLPTNLKITVLDDMGNFIEGAEVTLFGTEDDYRNEENPVAEKQLTDKKGQVRFTDLESKVYFVLVKKGDMNNDGGAVQTSKLAEGKYNKVNIIIE